MSMKSMRPAYQVTCCLPRAGGARGSNCLGNLTTPCNHSPLTTLYWIAAQAALETALTSRKMVTSRSGETETFRVQLELQKCVYARDALTKVHCG